MAFEGTAANPIGFGLVLSRLAQSVCALLSYLVFQKHFAQLSRASLYVDVSFQAVPPLTLVTVVYSSLLLVAVLMMKKTSISTWYKFGIVTVPFDLAMAILSLVVAILLNSTRLDCQNLLREKFVRKPTGSIRHRSLSSGSRYNIDDIDRQCAASLFIYWISLVLVLLYSFTILLTILRLKHYRQLLLDKWDELASVYIESIIEAQVQQVVERMSSGSSYRSPHLSPRSPERTPFMPGFGYNGVEPVVYRQRASHETSSSCNTDLISMDTGNGCRLAEDSRGSSLISFKGD